MSDERVVLVADRVFKWDGPKRKQTLIKAKLGRLVLTDRRFVFLSTGKNDLTVRKLASGVMGPGAGLHTSSTSALDITALTNEGALDIPTAQLRGAELHGMFKVMTVRWVDAAGTEQVATFAQKNGGMPDGATWVTLIERLAGGEVGAATAQTSTAAAGWFADPHGRHELRYWDGSAWTDHVADGGQQSTDPSG